MTKGDRVKLVDGMGGYHEGIITGSDPSACKIRITDSYQGFGKREYRLHMAVSPIKPGTIRVVHRKKRGTGN